MQMRLSESRVFNLIDLTNAWSASSLNHDQGPIVFRQFIWTPGVLQPFVQDGGEDDFAFANQQENANLENEDEEDLGQGELDEEDNLAANAGLAVANNPVAVAANAGLLVGNNLVVGNNVAPEAANAGLVVGNAPAAPEVAAAGNDGVGVAGDGVVAAAAAANSGGTKRKHEDGEGSGEGSRKRICDAE